MNSNLFHWRSLKTRVTLFTLAIFLLSIWSLAFYASRMLREDMTRQLGEQQFSMASFIAAQVNQELGDRLKVLENGAGRLTPATLGNTAAMQTFLEQRPIIQSMFNGGIFVTRLDGAVIADVPLSAGRTGVNYMDVDHIAVALKEGKATIGRPAMGKKLLAPVFGMTVPIRDTQGRVIGALSGAINLGMPNFLDKITVGHYGKTGGYLLVAPQHRLIVTASDKRRIMEALPTPGLDPLIERRIEGQAGTGVFVNPRGVEVLSSAKEIPAAGWLAAVSLPTEEAFAPIGDMQQRMLLATIVLTLLAGGLTWWMLRRQLSPMLATVKTLATLSDTNQPLQPLPVERQDEVGQLIGGFNRLLETLGKREEALRASEERHRLLFESSRDALMTLAPPSWRFTGANQATLELFRAASASEFTELGPWNVSPQRQPDGRPSDEKAQEMIATAMRTGKVAFEWEHQRLDGSLFPADVRLTRMELGEEVFLQATVCDITESKQIEAAREQLVSQLREAQRIARIGSWEWTAGGDAVTWSEGLHVMLRREPDAGAPTFKNLPQFYTPESWTRLAAAVASAIEAGTPYELELEMIRGDGTTCWTTTRGEAVRGPYGAVAKLRGTVLDITERKRAEGARVALESQLRESQKMEALGTLAGGVAHDFNNALAAITGNVELARQDVGPGHAALESLEEIGKASRRAKDMVQQILAFGRRQKLERKVMSLALVVVKSARLLRATLPAGVSLNVDCEGDTPAVAADVSQVEQVLLNLYSNALQAVQDQGRPGAIEVRLNAYEHKQGVARGNLRPGHYACLAVRDNGSGMDEATRSRIFEPFFTTKPPGKGTGLGLSVVHGIVRTHEASIDVESAPGEGSVIRIYFPAAEAAVPDVMAPTPNNTPFHGKGKHVLYVDDEAAIIFLMTRLLERQGYRVSGYTDPHEALAAARANPDQFDLVVTDYNMPRMTGLEVAQALKEIRAGLPVVLASGYITEELRAKAPAAGVRELIYKPNTVDELCEVVARIANAQSGNESAS